MAWRRPRPPLLGIWGGNALLPSTRAMETLRRELIGAHLLCSTVHEKVAVVIGEHGYGVHVACGQLPHWRRCRVARRVLISPPAQTLRTPNTSNTFSAGWRRLQILAGHRPRGWSYLVICLVEL